MNCKLFSERPSYISYNSVILSLFVSTIIKIMTVSTTPSIYVEYSSYS
jgi:hypothetical protein